ncbi:MAG: hypothetical protein KDB22_02935 [Planctomycetales bacterium]|nr:hypothetical protein [Planctomycetales bacterium]
MHKLVFLTFLALVCVTERSVAQLNVSTHNRIVTADSSYWVSVEVSGDVSVNAVSLAFGLNDGGAAAGGTENASVIGSSLDHTMWDTDPATGTVSTPGLSNVVFTPVLPTGATVADMLGASVSSSATASAGSVLLYLELDLSSKMPGETVMLNPDFAGLTQAIGPNASAIGIASVSAGTLKITRKGDANGDGVVNNLDIGGFILALTNFAGYAAANPGIDGLSVLDFSGDGIVNNLDLGGFISALTGI